LKCINEMSKFRKDDVFEIQLQTKKMGNTVVCFHAIKKI